MLGCMKRVTAQIGFLAALVGCVADAPPFSESYETRQFEYRGGTLGSDCSVAREFEAQGGVPEVHNVLDPLDQYGFVQPRDRIALLLCRSGVLCSQSITFLLDSSSAASTAKTGAVRCHAQNPMFDTHSWEDPLAPFSRSGRRSDTRPGALNPSCFSTRWNQRRRSRSFSSTQTTQ
jgi:hypothetical protein